MLDWGIGGLGCYRLLKQARPDLPVVYWSDTGEVPYGKLPKKALTARVEQISEALQGLGITHFLVACNAASTVLDQAELRLPTIGVIEASQLSLPPNLRGTLAVIGGARTVRSGLHRRLLSRADLRVVSRVAQPLSGHIEAGTTGSPQYLADLAAILAPLRHADALLLACTHYPAIAEDLRRALGERCLLLDPAEALIREALRRFELVEARFQGDDRFLTTGSPEAMRLAALRAWQITLPRCEPVSLR
jgi:glutamate racemase